MESAATWKQPDVQPDSIAFLPFTSGTTGVPKGVMVAHRNIRSFLDYMVARYAITEHDRFSQMFDMTFDLSLFDVFMAWERGACVYCPDRKTLIHAGRYIRENELTVWFSVPSTALFMERLGTLKPGRYPSLRWSLFCGEPLLAETARTWAEAAPNSVVENLYGPTELTLACALYRWDAERSPAECETGIVPIGEPYPKMKALVADDAFREVAEGLEGELLMAGPQMTLGYWDDAERTAAAFVEPLGKSEVYYRTGDLVRRVGEGGPLAYLGRTDFQIQIQGHRVELGEIETVVREESGCRSVVAAGWPRTASGATGIEVFLEGRDPKTGDLRDKVAARLPDYMAPKRFHYLDRLPLNANGKLDREALSAILEDSQ